MRPMTKDQFTRYLTKVCGYEFEHGDTDGDGMMTPMFATDLAEIVLAAMEEEDDPRVTIKKLLGLIVRLGIVVDDASWAIFNLFEGEAYNRHNPVQELSTDIDSIVANLNNLKIQINEDLGEMKVKDMVEAVPKRLRAFFGVGPRR